MWVTFLEGYSALAALSLSASTVSNRILNCLVESILKTVTVSGIVIAVTLSHSLIPNITGQFL